MNREIKNGLFTGLFWILYSILIGLLFIKFIAYLNG
jgi:hypothetical protein